MKHYTSIETDSRKLVTGSLFVCEKGETHDGHEFIKLAIEKGVAEIIHSQKLDDEIIALCEERSIALTFVEQEKVRGVLIDLLQKFYPITTKVIAVTGTDGKSSVVHFCRELCGRAGVPSASIGTIGAFVTDGNGTRVFNATDLTTPDLVSSYQILSRLSEEGITYAFIEYSSIGIHQGRLAGITIYGSVFTTFGTDHLLYHKTIEEYWKQKERLFSEILDPNGFAVVNKKVVEGHVINFITNDVLLIDSPDQQLTEKGYEFVFEGTNIETPFFATFHVENVNTAMTVCRKLGLSLDVLKDEVKNISAPCGRFESFYFSGKPLVIVDYAHTPEGLEKVLGDTQKLIKHRGGNGELWVVFGVGGGRDSTKRAPMGTIASNYAQHIIVTNDNPRMDDPEVITKDIVSGISKTYQGDYSVIHDRAIAISTALSKAATEDVVLIVGKGHEQYQIIGTEKTHFSDQEEVVNYLN